MTTPWYIDTFSNKSLAVQFLKASQDTWIQKRNIQLVEEPLDDGETMVYYTCEYRIISNDVYEELTSEPYSPANEMLKSDQLDLMEAIADIYTLLLGGTV